MAAPAPAQSDGLPTEPMLRINAPGHIAIIRRIATDAAERFAVTASDDKTVRVWSLPDGTLQRVIWLPSGEGNLGKAFAVALSPDGGTIAVGGWTGPTGGDKNIYLFDRASGALLRRLPGLPNVVNHLAFSPDGRRLAAALGGANGIRVFDAADGYRPLPSDGDYGDGSYWVDFDHAGRLVSASYDGFVRLYSADRYDRPAVPKAKVPGIGRPRSVAFSPDGRHIAVGDRDSATVAVLRDRDLQPETFPTVTGLDASQINVAWSQDGGQLFAGGYSPTWASHGRRWDKAGAGSFVDIAGARNTVMQFVPLRGQQMLFADAAGFGLIDPAGKATRLQDQGSIDTRGASDEPADQRRCADGSGHRSCVESRAALCARAPDHRGRSGRGQSAGQRDHRVRPHQAHGLGEQRLPEAERREARPEAGRNAVAAWRWCRGRTGSCSARNGRCGCSTPAARRSGASRARFLPRSGASTSRPTAG